MSFSQWKCKILMIFMPWTLVFVNVDYCCKDIHFFASTQCPLYGRALLKCTLALFGSWAPVPQWLLCGAGSDIVFLRTSLFTWACQAPSQRWHPHSMIVINDRIGENFLALSVRGSEIRWPQDPQAPASAVPDTQMGQIVSLSASREEKTNSLIWSPLMESFLGQLQKLFLTPWLSNLNFLSEPLMKQSPIGKREMAS